MNETPQWRRDYEENPRSRPHASNPKAERAIENLWHGCRAVDPLNVKETLWDTLATIDAISNDLVDDPANPLMPAKREPWKPPTPPPGIDGDLIARWPENKADQKALELRLAKAREAHEANHRDLLAAAEYRQWSDWIGYLKRVTAEPVKFALERADAEASRCRWNNALTNYRHDRNVYTLANAEERRRMVESADDETKRIHRAETREINLPLFGNVSGGETHRQLLGQLHNVGGQTWKIIEAGQKRENTLRKTEALIAAHRREQDAVSVKRTTS